MDKLDGNLLSESEFLMGDLSKIDLNENKKVNQWKV